MKGFTLLFEALILQLCSSMQVLKASQIVGVSDDKIWLMLERYIDAALDNMDISELKILGPDETSRAKRHEYITLFVDLQKKETVYITDGKDSNTAKNFVKFLKAHKGCAITITVVSSDMSSSFIKGVHENLPNAETTFDKFHILKLINNAVDEVRKEEVKSQFSLRGCKYIFLKNHKILSSKQKKTLKEFSMTKRNLKSVKAMHIRENF